MIKVILSDLARTFLFVKDPTWTDTLNKLYAKLEKEKQGNYNFWDYFELNYEYLEMMKKLKQEYKVTMFTSGVIQNSGKLLPLLSPVFEIIYNEEKVGHKKSEIESYTYISNDLNVTPQEILFIDDDPSYISAAEKAKLNTFRMKNNESLKDYLNSI